MNLAYAHVILGDGAAALEQTTAAQEGFAAIGSVNHDSEVLRYRALALLLLGRAEEATSTAEHALDRARVLTRRLEEGRTLRVLAQSLASAATSTQEQQASLDHLAESAAILESLNARYDLALTLLETARLTRTLGVPPAPSSPDAAHRPSDDLTRAIAIFREIGAHRDLSAAEALQSAASLGPLHPS